MDKTFEDFVNEEIKKMSKMDAAIFRLSQNMNEVNKLGAIAYAAYCVEQERIVWKKTIERLEKTIDFNVKTNIDLMKKLNGTPKPTEP